MLRVHGVISTGITSYGLQLKHSKRRNEFRCWRIRATGSISMYGKVLTIPELILIAGTRVSRSASGCCSRINSPTMSGKALGGARGGGRVEYRPDRDERTGKI